MSKRYSKETLNLAVASNLDSKSAAKMFRIPASTIRRHRNTAELRERVGRPSYLNEEQERCLVAMLQLLPDFGFHVTMEVALKIAHDYFVALGLTNDPGKKWLVSFVKRYGDEIKWKRQAKLERVREESFTEDVRSSWFSLLENVMLMHNLFDKPHQIFNVDETGFTDKTKGELVIVRSSQRHVFESYGGSGKHYRTALICISAGGFVLSPLFLYSGKHLMDSWCKGGPNGAQYGVTEKGWMDTEKFEYWLENMFIPSTNHINRPLLLILDGYGCHISLKILNLLKNNNVICLMLPAHKTHALQPVDIVLFNSIKTDWMNIVKNHLKDGNKAVANGDFPRLMKKLFVEKRAFSSTRIVSSFARSGIWPFDKTAMSDKVSRKHARTSITNDLPASTTASVRSPINTNSSSLVSSSNNSSLNIHNANGSSSIDPSSIQSNMTNSNSPTSVDNNKLTNGQTTDVSESSSNTTNQNSRNNLLDSTSRSSDDFGQSNQINETLLSTLVVPDCSSSDHLQSQRSLSPSPIQQVVLDGLATPPQSNDSSIVHLDSSSSSLANQQPATIIAQKLSHSKKRSKNENQSRIDVENTINSKSPVAAVRRIVEEVLSQHQDQMQRIAAVKKPIRGSRLRSTIGLNITEDEFVLKKLEERETKKKKKNHETQMNSNELMASEPKRKKRKPATQSDMIMNEKRATKDIDLDLAIRALQTVIDHIDEDNLSDCCSEEF